MIFPISEIDIRMAPGAYPFPPELRAAIADHWAGELSRNPHLWNGRVLSMIAPTWPDGVRIEDGVFRARVLEDEYAAYLAWRGWNYPEIGIRNGFGSGLIKSSDGALIYGEMGPRTANAGRIYPPGGSLEPRDVLEGGRVDIIRSIELEIAEETGLSIADAGEGETFAAFWGPQISIARVYHFRETAEELVEIIRENMKSLEHEELADVHIIRKPEDIDPRRAPPFAILVARHALRTIG